MRVLVLSGDSRSRSDNRELNNSEKLAEAFLQGIRRHIFFTTGKRTMDAAKANVRPCNGCNSCWQSSPGKCNIIGDARSLKQKFSDADAVIWSLPIYYYGPPSILKAFVDVEPQNKKFFERLGSKKENSSSGNAKRQKHVLICACDFNSAGSSYDSFFKQFDTMYEGRQIKILCPQGELLSVPQMRKRTDAYLEYVRKAGYEFAGTGKISEETEKYLTMPIFKKES